MKVFKVLKEIKSDDNVKCIVLRINSPGGGVTAFETILEECKDTNKPIICSFGNLAASGGYYIATSVEKSLRIKQVSLAPLVFLVLNSMYQKCLKDMESTLMTFQEVSTPGHILFHPLNDSMKTNLTRNMDRISIFQTDCFCW